MSDPTTDPTIPPIVKNDAAAAWAWAKTHPGVSIPVAAYLAGCASPTLVKLAFRLFF